MSNAQTVISILPPTALKAGAVAPDGRVVKSGMLHTTKDMLVAEIDFTDGTGTALMWPLGTNWKEAPDE
ncbi:hypothetical protein [Mycetocola saprophilus]|uniref:hypothetical protein n=1 Tax=Mycetocola saprophilus TaxID=76636 RepID=UPI0004C08A7C|nr:hypothetical protein [Mycetocola saprophilus]